MISVFIVSPVIIVIVKQLSLGPDCIITINGPKTEVNPRLLKYSSFQIV